MTLEIGKSCEPHEYNVKYVVQCGLCKTFHFDSDSRCPQCNAGLYWQCGFDGDKFEAAKIGIQQRAKREIIVALKCADQNTVNWLKNELLNF